MELNIFKLNRISFGEMYADAKNYLQKTYNDDDQQFSMASPFGQILSVILDMGQMMFYYIEDSITEMNIRTATRENSIYGIARMLGHNPTRAIAATGSVRISYKSDTDMTGTTLIIPRGNRITCKENNLTYVIDLPSEDLRIEMVPRSYVLANIKQGSLEKSATYTGTGNPLLSFNVTAGNGKEIDMNDVKVFVNSEEWGKYDSLYDMAVDTKGCIVKTGMNEGIDIFFGNGSYGKIPELGAEIYVEYLATAGYYGNLPSIENIEFTMTDPCYDLQGNEVDASDALSIVAEDIVSFGSDSEPMSLTKLLAPRISRSLVLANTDNYITFLEKFNCFSYIDAFTEKDDETGEIISKHGHNSNCIYMLLVPDINKRKKSSENYFTIPISNFMLSEREKNNIYDIIEKSGQKMLSVVNKIVDPKYVYFSVNVSLIIFEGYSEDLIRTQIVSKFSEYFLKNQRMDRVPKSDLIAIVEGIDGVDSVNVWFTSRDAEEFYKKGCPSDDPYINNPKLDSFGDIILKRAEIALIRGGWSDRHNVFINDGIDKEKPSALNILISGVTQDSYNVQKHNATMKTLK